MAILVTCACGKQLKARDEHAGRTTICPECGEELTIPGGGGDEDAVAHSRKSTATARGKEELESGASQTDRKPARKVNIARLVKGGIAVWVVLLIPVVYLQFQESKKSNRSVANLKKVYAGLMGFQEKNKTVPATINGTNASSWRVVILPFIQEDALYEQYNLNEPYFTDTNNKVLRQMPMPYAPVGGVKTKEPYSTFYQALVGEGAAFDRQKGIRIPQECTDGAAQTIIVAEAAKAVPWTHPKDLEYYAGGDPPKLGGNFSGDSMALFADGSVRLLKKDISPEVLRALITRSGGDRLDASKQP